MRKEKGARTARRRTTKKGGGELAPSQRRNRSQWEGIVEKEPARGPSKRRRIAATAPATAPAIATASPTRECIVAGEGELEEPRTELRLSKQPRWPYLMTLRSNKQKD